VAFHLEEQRRAESSIVQLERVIQDLESRENTSERQDRKPEQLKKIEFVGQRLTQSILQVLLHQNEEMSIDELVYAIYQPVTETEIKSCKATLTTALNRAVKRGLLTRVSEGVFKAQDLYSKVNQRLARS
jgi:hypothetical protein